MQIIYHTAPGLTTIQKFFIERSIELLYRSSIDSYRVRVKNPRAILRELRDTIVAYEKGQIRHFLAIAPSDKTKFALKDEALSLIELDPHYLRFNTFSIQYFTSILKSLDERNYKRTKDCLSLLLHENSDYLGNIIAGLLNLLNRDDPTEDTDLWALLDKLDKTLGILYSELLEIGFSKGFLYRFVYGVFVNTTDKFDFNVAIQSFVERLSLNAVPYKVVFRIDTTSKVKHAIQTIDSISIVSHDLDELEYLAGNREFDNFIVERPNRCFIKSRVPAPDYLKVFQSCLLKILALWLTIRKNRNTVY